MATATATTASQTYAPGGPWFFAAPFVREVWGWESSKTKEHTEEKVNCVLPVAIYNKLPGGHEHQGTRLYHSRAEAMKALEIATGGAK